MPNMNDSEDGRRLLGEFADSVKEFRTWHAKAEGEIKQMGSVATETKEKLVSIEAKLTDIGGKVQEYAATLQKHDEELKRLRQIGFRMGASAGEDGGIDTRSFGTRFTQTNEFKAAQFNGRFKFASTMSGRIIERKAANTITESGSGMVILPQRVGFFMPPQLPVVMRDLLDVVALTGTNAVEYVIENWNYAADYQINEGDRKAQGDVTYTDATATVRTIAWFVKVSRQMLSDVPYVASTIDQRLLYGIAKKEDYELLWGDGSAGHIKGVMPQATAYTAAAGTTRIDEIAGAIATLNNTGYAVSAVVLNPMDWSQMMLAKATGTGMYLLGGPLITEPTRLWGVQIVPSVAMTAGQYLVGAFPGNAAIFDRETATVEISFENEDDFVRNLATIRAEERLTLAVFVPAAFLKGTFKAPAPNIENEAPAPAHNKSK